MFVHRIGRIFLFIPFLYATALGQHMKKVADPLPWISFNWVGDSLANKYFDKLAITIPLKIDDLPYAFIAQLDLGAVNTMLYGKSLRPYLQLSPAMRSKLDTPGNFFTHLALTLDKVLFQDRSVENYSDFGDSLTLDSVKSPTPKLIGTIAPDLFQNELLIIDYPNRRLCVVDSLPSQMAGKIDFVPIKIRKGRIKIPFTIGSEEHDIMFDTGASIFSIYTSSENSGFFAGPELPATDSIVGSSWGHEAVIYEKKMSIKVKLGKHQMSPATVCYKIDKNEKQFEDEENIIGLTGNAWFLNNVIVIDYRNLRFGIM